MKTRRLKLFGYIVRSHPDEDHVCALNAGINEPPKNWRQPRIRPRQTRLVYAESNRTSDNKTSGCGRPGTLHKTELDGVKWWRRLRFCSRGLSHDDDDDVRSMTWFGPGTLDRLWRRGCLLWMRP